MGKNDVPRLYVSTKVQPLPVGSKAELPSVLDPGLYEIDVVLSGDNVEPTEQTWRIRCPDTWHDDDEAMIASTELRPIERPPP